LSDVPGGPDQPRLPLRGDSPPMARKLYPQPIFPGPPARWSIDLVASPILADLNIQGRLRAVASGPQAPGRTEGRRLTAGGPVTRRRRSGQSAAAIPGSEGRRLVRAIVLSVVEGLHLTPGVSSGLFGGASSRGLPRLRALRESWRRSTACFENRRGRTETALTSWPVCGPRSGRAGMGPSSRSSSPPTWERALNLPGRSPARSTSMPWNGATAGIVRCRNCVSVRHSSDDPRPGSRCPCFFGEATSLPASKP